MVLPDDVEGDCSLHRNDRKGIWNGKDGFRNEERGDRGYNIFWVEDEVFCVEEYAFSGRNGFPLEAHGNDMFEAELRELLWRNGVVFV